MILMLPKRLLLQWQLPEPVNVAVGIGLISGMAHHNLIMLAANLLGVVSLQVKRTDWNTRLKVVMRSRKCPEPYGE